MDTGLLDDNVTLVHRESVVLQATNIAVGDILVGSLDSASGKVLSVSRVHPFKDAKMDITLATPYGEIEQIWIPGTHNVMVRRRVDVKTGRQA